MDREAVLVRLAADPFALRMDRVEKLRAEILFFRSYAGRDHEQLVEYGKLLCQKSLNALVGIRWLMESSKDFRLGAIPGWRLVKDVPEDDVTDASGWDLRSWMEERYSALEWERRVTLESKALQPRSERFRWNQALSAIMKEIQGLDVIRALVEW